MITIPDFQCSKQSSNGREERIEFIISEVKKHPDYHFEGAWLIQKLNVQT